MRPFFIIVLVSTFYNCGPVFAQAGMGSTLPPLGATSPLGTDPGTPIGGAGIPMGPSLAPAPVVSSVPYPTSAGAAACSTLGMPPAAMSGSSSSYDGGGVTLNGAAPPATAAPVPTASGTRPATGISATSGLSATSGMTATAGLSGMCGSGSSTAAASSILTSASSTPGARSGVPLDSTEINNLGVSTWAAVPPPSVTPMTGTVPTVTTSTLP